MCTSTRFYRPYNNEKQWEICNDVGKSQGVPQWNTIDKLIDSK